MKQYSAGQRGKCLTTMRSLPHVTDLVAADQSPARRRTHDGGGSKLSLPKRIYETYRWMGSPRFEMLVVFANIDLSLAHLNN